MTFLFYSLPLLTAFHYLKNNNNNAIAYYVWSQGHQIFTNKDVYIWQWYVIFWVNLSKETESSRMKQPYLIVATASCKDCKMFCLNRWRAWLSWRRTSELVSTRAFRSRNSSLLMPHCSSRSTTPSTWHQNKK